MHIIFDFDGTLADTSPILEEYLARHHVDMTMLKEYGLKGLLEQHRIRRWQLPFAMFFVKRAMRKQLGKAQLCIDKKALMHLATHHTLGIVSSNSKQNIRRFLHEQDIWHYFRFVHADSSLFGKDRMLLRMCRKYSITPGDIIYIGDEDRDIIAAKSIGAKVIAVTWGYNSRKVLEKYRPDCIAKDQRELLQAIKRLE